MRLGKLASAVALVVLAACGATLPDADAPMSSPGGPPGDGQQTPAAEALDDGAAEPDGKAAEAHDDGAAESDAGASGGVAPVAAGPTRPAWLGTRELPTRADGYGEPQPTPPELVNRRLPPPADTPQPPPDDARFAATVEAVPDAVLARSTWSPECPVERDELRYVTVTFWGFDQRSHTGELLLHASVAEDVARVFEQLYEARFPIEEMRVVDAHELSAPPTGDGNNTTAFVCRPAVGQTRWSDHAYGRAVDINPFHNPYVRDELVLPELAIAYADRGAHRPGMIQPGDVVTDAFAAIGWGWGGDWQSARDWMHFSASGR